MVSTTQEMAPGAAGGFREIHFLPSHLFFARSVALPPGIRAEEIASFIEVSVEQLSPFPINQLYYGYFLPDGADKALIFAAYRKKAGHGENNDWEDASLVAPDLIGLLGMGHDQPTVAFLRHDGEMTAVYWSGTDPVPDRVVSRAVKEEGAEETPDEIRRQLLRRLGVEESKARLRHIDEINEATLTKNEIVFSLREKTGEAPTKTTLPRALVWALDVRDKDYLLMRHRRERRNKWIWNGLLAIAAIVILFGVVEIGLFAGWRALRATERQVESQAPVVARIEEEADLAHRIEELSNARLRPFEMLSAVNQARPNEVHFLSARANRTSGLIIDALAANPQALESFQERLGNSQAVREAQVIDPRSREGRISFTLRVSFAEGALAHREPITPAQTPVIANAAERLVEADTDGAEGSRRIAAGRNEEQQ